MQEKDNHSKPVVLVIDDSVQVEKILRRFLEKQGYSVLGCRNGKDGYLLAKQKKPHMILLDVMMPGEDGFQVISKLKADAATMAIPVMFLTAKDDLKSKVDGFEYGAVDFIPKPFYPQEVEARVRTHLKLNRATNALINSQAAKLKEIENAQINLLISPDELPEAQFEVYFSAYMEAGGDFYEALNISNDIFGYFVGDISGHSIKTSYLTSSLKALLKQNCTPIYKPSESMQLINNILFHLLNGENYLTAIYAHVNRQAMEVTLVNAGHPPALYVPKEGKAKLIEMDGDIMGLFEESIFISTKFSVQKGDRFYLYTDGLIEDPNEKNVWTGQVKKLLKIVDLIRNLKLKDSIHEMTKRLQPDSGAVADDTVLLGFEV
jgi:sigma-B regulation protein RsbU (phosphoserine phosphatase)